MFLGLDKKNKKKNQKEPPPIPSCQETLASVANFLEGIAHLVVAREREHLLLILNCQGSAQIAARRASSKEGFRV